MGGLNLSEFPARNKDEQHKPGAQSGAKPKTLAYGGGECIETKVGNFHIYQTRKKTLRNQVIRFH